LKDGVMRMNALLLAAMLPALLFGTAAAVAADHSLSVTIYADDLALVQDRRDIQLQGGRQRIEFQDVSAKIRPETVTLTAGGIAIIEQNFDFDLLTPAKLMEKAVGQQVTLVRTNPGNGAEVREQAQVLATNGGVVLKIGERIEVLRDDGLPVRVIFDKVPDNLRARPTLSVTVTSPSAGTRPATLSYLTPGLGWRADYVALYDQSSSKIDVQGWVTLTNSSGTTYENAQTLLVAGAPSRAGANFQFGRMGRQEPATVLVRAGTETGNRERLGDYYLYPLTERTTIANMQTKQVSFLDVHGVPAEHVTNFTTTGWGRHPCRRAPRPPTSSRPARMQAWAISCRRGCCVSISAIGAAILSSSARAASITLRWGRPYRCRLETRSTSKSTRSSSSAPASRRSAGRLT
jgi:hypothetical protein